MKNFTAKRISLLAVFTAAALIMYVVESLFPPLFIPGAKMGLSNIFTVLAVVLLGPIDAVILVLLRTLLANLIVGNFSTLIYSLSAGLISVIVTDLMYAFLFPKISIVAISVFSAVIHNLTQNVIFCIMTESFLMLVYSPYLALIGAFAGCVVGFAAELIIRGFPDEFISKYFLR